MPLREVRRTWRTITVLRNWNVSAGTLLDESVEAAQSRKIIMLPQPQKVIA